MGSVSIRQTSSSKIWFDKFDIIKKTYQLFLYYKIAHRVFWLKSFVSHKLKGDGSVCFFVFMHFFEVCTVYDHKWICREVLSWCSLWTLKLILNNHSNNLLFLSNDWGKKIIIQLFWLNVTNMTREKSHHSNNWLFQIIIQIIDYFKKSFK